CHGSFQGRGGFRLSLFGYEPEKDYAALTREQLGRRVNLANPDASLILMKPTGKVGHGGGVRFAQGSWEYRVLRDWIARGAGRNKDSGKVGELTITPPEIAFKSVEQAQPLKVIARFADGSEVEVTAFCEFRSYGHPVAEDGA